MSLINSFWYAVGGGGGCVLLPDVPTSNLEFDHVGPCITGADGADISLWVDSSSAGNNLTNGDAGSNPNIKAAFLNGLNVAEYAGGQLLVLDSPLSVTSLTYVSVMRCTADTTSILCSLLSNDDFGGSGSPQIRIFQSKVHLVKRGVTVIGSGSTNLNTANFYTVGITYDGTNWAIYLNGSADGSGSNAQTFDQPIKHQGASNAGNENFIGYIAEDLLWTRVLDGAELITVFDALRDRWAHY